VGMTLLYAPTSPYVRKVLVVAHETGQADDIEPVFTTANPVSENEDLDRHNPLGKIPVLLTDDGPLFDSRVICEFLASRGSDTGIFPATGRARWHALAQQALGDGLLDAALVTRYEAVMRPAALQWAGWSQAQTAKMKRAVAAMAGDLPRAPTIGAISFGCALGYLDFRFPNIDWRGGHPALADWFASFGGRSSMQLTQPRDA